MNSTLAEQMHFLVFKGETICFTLNWLLNPANWIKFETKSLVKANDNQKFGMQLIKFYLHEFD